MRRKEHSVGAMQQDKAYLKNKINPVVKPVGLKRYVAGGEYVSSVVNGIQKIGDKLEENMIKEERNSLLADGLLQNYRDKLSMSRNENEFDNLANSIDEDVKNYFMSSDDGKDFWEKHGNKILEKNRVDVEKLREVKNYDFGKEALKGMLADNQSMLVRANEAKGNALLESGVEKINNTKFLDENEREEFRDKYLRTGIYNLALSDVNAAKLQAKKYNLDDKLITALDEIDKLKIKQANDEALKKAKKEYINNWSSALSLWQQNQRGEISPVEFYVLSKEYEDVFPVKEGDAVLTKDSNLSNAYKIIRKMNGGEYVDVREIKNASDFLIEAYNEEKLGLDEVSSLQNKLVYSQEEENNQFFDKEIDELADLVFMKDIETSSKEFSELMEEKARLGLLLYDAYYTKKLALMRDFTNGGGILTPKIDRLLKKQALNETRDEFGYKENLKGSLSLGDLVPVLKQYYTGRDEAGVWKKFSEVAPYSEDKKDVLKKIAMMQQKLELSYPIFNSWSEVAGANLKVGDKFYFKGRLAQKA